ncbi:MAG: RagB/SusD family nutrient uptake outer membrane protein [Cyclobacteriaceae bacterium]|nr:RagB/SusD family nutrient uptake outer membrane protein [Cyclobacteriaceae bacterium]
MKKINSILKTRTIRNATIVSIIFSFVGLSSCNNFLDEVPDNRVSLDNLNKAAQLLTNAYSTSSPAFTDWMTDDLSYTIGTIKRPHHDRLFTWADDTSDPTEQDSPVHYWSEAYNAIAHANEVLAVLDDLPALNDEQKAQKRAVEAEAFLTRAYAHFMLVNIFAKHYDPTTASSYLGIPIVEKPETTFIATYNRNTVQEVYDFVEQGIIKGISLVDDTFYANSGKYHFNKNAALAFASRFYLYKGEYQKCYDFSSELLDPEPNLYVRNLNSDKYQGSNISSFPQIYSSPKERANLMLMRKISLIQRSDFAFGVETNFYFFLFITTSPFGEDQRENAVVKGEDGALPNRYENLFQRSSLNSNVGTPYHIAIAFRGEEVLLNRAESALHLGRQTQAIADLQTLTNNRYAVTNPSETALTVNSILSHFVISNVPMFSDNQTQGIFNYLLDERRKEFLIQGLRWFDIRRFDLEIEHTTPQGTFTLTANDPRKVLQIPKTAIDVGGLEPNPR